MDQVGNAKYFSTIELRSSYHQMRIAEEDIPKTAFNTRCGRYEYAVVPCGLTNAPATFMNIMDDVFEGYSDKFVMVYLDDILIYSDTWENHEKHVKLDLERLREHKLYVNCSNANLAYKKSSILDSY